MPHTPRKMLHQGCPR